MTIQYVIGDVSEMFPVFFRESEKGGLFETAFVVSFCLIFYKLKEVVSRYSFINERNLSASAPSTMR